MFPVLSPTQAVALARRYLKTNKQDIACLVASGRKVMPPEDDTTAAAAAAVADSTAAAAAPAAAMAAGAVGAAGAVQGASKYPALCHRLVVLECEPGRPRSLLVSGVSCIVRILTVLSCTVFYCKYCQHREVADGGCFCCDCPTTRPAKRRLWRLGGQSGVPAGTWPV
jgi:hypothetical protein